MPTGWSVDYSSDYLWHEGTVEASFGRTTLSGGTPVLSQDPSVFLKEVALTKRDLEARWDPTTKKYIMFGPDLDPQSEDWLTIGATTYTILGVEKRNDGAQWFIFAQVNS